MECSPRFRQGPGGGERRKALADETHELIGRDLQMVGLHDRRVDGLADHPLADLFLERRVVLGHETTLPGQGLDDALVFQLTVCLGHRVAVDAQLLRQRPDRRERFARS